MSRISKQKEKTRLLNHVSTHTISMHVSLVGLVLFSEGETTKFAVNLHERELLHFHWSTNQEKDVYNSLSHSEKAFKTGLIWSNKYHKYLHSISYTEVF